MKYDPDFVPPYNCTNAPQFPELFITMAILVRTMISKSNITKEESERWILDFVNYLSTLYNLYQLIHTIYKFSCIPLPTHLREFPHEMPRYAPVCGYRFADDASEKSAQPDTYVVDGEVSDMDLVMVSRVRNRWIFFVIFVVLHRSLSVSMMRSTSLDTAKYSNYTCTEINNFGTDISSAIGVIRYLYIINTIIFSFKIVLCGSILLFYFGLMPEADLLSSASFCNIYALMSSLSAILRLIWNYKGLSVIMTFLTEKDPKFCKDMPSWMASNLTKMAYSVVLLIVEFGLLLREQEAMADYLKHWTDVRNVRRQEENTPNENCYVILAIRATPQAFTNMTCEEYPNFYPGMIEILRGRLHVFLMEFGSFLLNMISVYIIGCTWTTRVSQYAAVTYCLLAIMAQIFFHFGCLIIVLPKGVLRVLIKHMFNDATQCHPMPYWLFETINCLMYYIFLAPLASAVYVYALFMTWKWYILCVTFPRMFPADNVLQLHQNAEEVVQIAGPPTYEEVTSEQPPSYESVLSRGIPVAATIIIVEIDEENDTDAVMIPPDEVEGKEETLTASDTLQGASHDNEDKTKEDEKENGNRDETSLSDSGSTMSASTDSDEDDDSLENGELLVNNNDVKTASDFLRMFAAYYPDELIFSENDDAIEETSKSFLFHDVFHCKSYGTDPSIRFENDESSEMKPPVMLDLNMFLMNIPSNNNIQVGGEILREDESLSRNDMELNRDNE
ncbi:hypothetical protein L5515_018227 [Caenorhabditis briggsae]|uniref:Uncharacterized protein n=1 Tax=Caenorhabditis briggsae TaxID=6238 RepID=A0AAE9FFX4_CAEBR|nr:hypothetical protein L5515_018227 [Caenorhabditis briggsae]